MVRCRGDLPSTALSWAWIGAGLLPLLSLGTSAHACLGEANLQGQQLHLPWVASEAGPLRLELTARPTTPPPAAPSETAGTPPLPTRFTLTQAEPLPALPASAGHCYPYLWRGPSGRWELLLPSVSGVGGESFQLHLRQQEEGDFLRLEDAPRPLARLEPVSGTLFGLAHDWGRDSVASATAKLGVVPDLLVYFIHWPLDSQESRWLDEAVAQVAAANSALLLTLEPVAGLAAITPAEAERLARRLAQITARGVPLFLRFGHEMNGNWYPWGQRPLAYRHAYRTVASAVRRYAPATALIWAPAHGADYPAYAHPAPPLPPPSSPEFIALDSNGDGTLDGSDDPYAPYYPGDDVVDWVGLTLYHTGTSAAGRNELPAPAELATRLSGGSRGAPIPNFYLEYAERRGKPLALVETAALFDPAAPPGPGEQAIKEAWWRQLLAPTLRLRFPRLRMINWFEWRKPEWVLGGNEVDWRLSARPELAAAFAAALQHSGIGLRTAPAEGAAQP